MMIVDARRRARVDWFFNLGTSDWAGQSFDAS